MPGTYREHYGEWDRRYRAGESFASIARDYGVSASGVHKALRRLGTMGRPNYQERHAEYETLAEEWAALYRSGVGAKAIARRYGVGSFQSVLAQIRRLGVEQRSISEARRKYPVTNESAFATLDSEEAAYWFGFLMADGCVRTTANRRGTLINQYLVTLGLSYVDVDHIHRFAKFLGTERPLHEVTRHRKRDDQEVTKLYYLNVSSERLVMDLIGHGCVPRKTKVMVWPQALPEAMVNHFVRGYFDGDGTIAIRHSCQRDAAIGWVSGTPSFLERLRDEILRSTGVEEGPVRRDGNTNAYTLSYRRVDSVRILHDWLYKDATVFLPRKKDKFNQLFEFRKSVRKWQRGAAI